MKNSVILKSFSKGITVIMDDAISFEELLAHVAAKFREADGFFKDAAVAISLKGRTLTENQEKEILDTITQNSRLRILCLMGKEEEKAELTPVVQDHLAVQKDENCGQFYKGTLKNGQSIETEHSIIIIGDVVEGCSVYSAKDIIVLGKLAGEAYAGAGGDNNHFVAALEMSPSSLRIGDMVYNAPPQRASIWGLRRKSVPKIAYTYQEEVLIDPITKDLLDTFTR